MVNYSLDDSADEKKSIITKINFNPMNTTKCKDEMMTNRKQSDSLFYVALCLRLLLIDIIGGL